MSSARSVLKTHSLLKHLSKQLWQILSQVVFVFTALLLAHESAYAQRPQLSIYRFYSKPTTATANVAVYDIENDRVRYHRSSVHGSQSYALNGKPTCSNLLSDLQNFSLFVMKSVEYLTDQQLAGQSQLIQQILPEQVTFLEYSEHVHKSKIDFRDKNKYAESTLESDVEDHERVRTGALWVIAGQYLYPHQRDNAFFENTKPTDVPWGTRMKKADHQDYRSIKTIPMGLSPMPWQRDPKLKNSNTLKWNEEYQFAEIDRQKYPLVWEIGRAAQVKPEQAGLLMKAAATMIEEDISVIMQASPKDAYVFAKALDPVRKRLFMSMGFRPLVGACDSDTSCVLVAAYLDLLKKAPLGEISEYTQKILELTRGRYTAFDVVNLLRRIQAYYRAELDFYSERYGSQSAGPIVFHNLSQHYDLLLRSWAEQVGILDKEAFQFVDTLKAWRRDSSQTDPSLFDDIPLDQNLTDELVKLNALRLTNLSEELVSKPNALPLIILSAERYLEQRYQEMSITNGPDLIERLNTKIALQTTSAQVAKYIRQWQPHELKQMQFRTVRGWPYMDVQTKTVFTFVFTREQIKILKGAFSPMLSEFDRGGVMDQGYWFFRSLSANAAKL